METTVMQRTLEGGLEVAGLTWLQRQVAAIMDQEPAAQEDEDLLVALWLHQHWAWEIDLPTLKQLAMVMRKYDPGRRREELAAKGLYPYSPRETKRRKARSRQGAPA